MPSLERCWLFARLAVPPDGRPGARVPELVGTVLTDLVTAARHADPGADWFFDLPDTATGRWLSLGFHGDRTALDAVRARLLAYDPGVSFAPAPDAVRDAARGGPLASAGSDLALVLLGGNAPWLAGVELPLAVAHLRHLTGLVPSGDRLAFLFLHWQDRARRLTGAQRRDLAAQADAEAEKIVLAAGDLPLGGEVAVAWRHYLDRVADVVDRDHPAAPRGFLLAHHAQLTHERWGIGPDVDSLAALALRLSMVRDRPAVGPPAPVPQQRRQQPHARVRA
ncbi:hypothetical protein ACWENR_27815 [Micromonospora sp. NPDC004336]